MSASRAVLWDMDGTLIDSEEFHWIAWRNTLALEGITITREQFLYSFGQRDDSIIPRWLGTAATPERIEIIADAKGELYRHLIRRDGISPCLGLHIGCTGCTNRDGFRPSPRRRRARTSMRSLRPCRLPTFFRASSQRKMYIEGKPDPEVYLTAAARVGVSPDRCIVVEDAVAGVQGARSAGMRSIGVSHDGKQLPADVVVRSLDLLDVDAFEKLLEGDSCVATNEVQRT
jgi:beta-phosphoglucomutase-like phosphatase (HAD superfamily)